MSFILNLITVLLIAIGIISAISTTEKNRNWIYFRFDLSKISIDKFMKIDEYLNKIYLSSIFAIVLGIGIAIARIFR